MIIKKDGDDLKQPYSQYLVCVYHKDDSKGRLIDNPSSIILHIQVNNLNFLVCNSLAT